MASVSNGSESASIEARRHIEEIRRSKFSIGAVEPNPLTEDLHHAVRNLSAELYSKDVHFLLELIQNAEDNEYPPGVTPSLEFVITSKDITGCGATDTLLVCNNEIGFSKHNIESICSVGRSAKKGRRREGYIGEKGIGFKSVFLVSKQAYIFSNGYRVRFNDEPNPDCGIGFIVPEWVDEKPLSSDIQREYGSEKLPTTIIILPLRPEKAHAVKTQLSQMHPEILLFLSKIKQLLVRRSSTDSSRVDSVSEISVTSETDFITAKDSNAESFTVLLSAQAGADKAGEECCYYMWRQRFPVVPYNKVGERNDIDEWIITLAFPFGERLKRGVSAGIYSFLPTTMVTQFPFIIQSDFILSASRETIQFDNVWNQGILGCVPSAFVNAFLSCLSSAKYAPLSSVARAFEFLPVKSRYWPYIYYARQSIRTRLMRLRIMPCESFTGDQVCYARPTDVRRITPDFRKLLHRVKEQGVSLKGIDSTKFILHSSLDLDPYTEVLKFLEVDDADYDPDWYAKCIQSCDLLSQVSEEDYMDFLCFLADNWKKFSAGTAASTGFLKYDTNDSVRLCTVNDTRTNKYKVCFASNADQHILLNSWRRAFGCPSNLVFLPNSTQESLMCHKRKSFLCDWLHSEASVSSTSVHNFCVMLVEYLRINVNRRAVILLPQFLHRSLLNNFISEYEVKSICHSMPIIDGYYHVNVERTETLVPACGSKWLMLFGVNPYSEEKYIDIGSVYEETGPKNAGFVSFFSKYTKAVDLPKLRPPNVILSVAFSQLTAEQAFLLLDWVRDLQERGDKELPARFLESVRTGKWLKTISGFNTPEQCFLADRKKKSIFSKVGKVLTGLSAIDEQYYDNKIRCYKNELKVIGVRFDNKEVCRLITDHFTSLAASEMSKENAISMLKYLRFSNKSKMLDDTFFSTLKEGKWLKTSCGYRSPSESFLSSEMDDISQITSLPVIDIAYYGGRIHAYTAELKLLGAIMDLEQSYKLIAENFSFPAIQSDMTKSSSLLLLKCVRGSGLGVELVEKVKDQPWLKTNLGFRSPSECLLPDSTWGDLLDIIEVPQIDEEFYGSGIRSFMLELKAIGVAVDLSGAINTIAGRLKSLSNWCSLSSTHVMSLLICIKRMCRTVPSLPSEFKNHLSGVNWLKTRHGFKSASDSILSDSKWGTISHFVDLPLIDDMFYSIYIYKYRNELKMLGVIVDFEEGFRFVGLGLMLPKVPGAVTTDATLLLLQCMSFMLRHASTNILFEPFYSSVKENKWLKTHMGYRSPEECLLYDSHWAPTLERKDAPFLDENFYGPDISSYKEPLKAMGVKVDVEDICTQLADIIMMHTMLSAITRIYNFLNKFSWKPNLDSKSKLQIWIPDQSGMHGKWVSADACVLQDSGNLFSSHLFVLNKFYEDDLFGFFSVSLGVSEVPSIRHYIKLWKAWENVQQITSVDCCSFWESIIEQWNSYTEEMCREYVTKLPAATSSNQIQLVEKSEIFIPDDLELQKIFAESVEEPLVVWCPRYSLPSIPLSVLYGIYGSIGAQNLSASVKLGVRHGLPVCRRVEPEESPINKGLMKLLLSFLAGPKVLMPAKERQSVAQILLDTPVHLTVEPVTVGCSLQLPSGRCLVAETNRAVHWDKDFGILFFNRTSPDDHEKWIKFVTHFARAVSERCLGTSKYMVADLYKIIQMGLMFGFTDDAVEFLLMTENLRLFAEDTEFLCAAFSSEEESFPSEWETWATQTPKNLQGFVEDIDLDSSFPPQESTTLKRQLAVIESPWNPWEKWSSECEFFPSSLPGWEPWPSQNSSKKKKKL